MGIVRLIVLLVATSLLMACASSHILTGTPRPAIDPAQVRFYYAPPQVPYEEIALLETSSGAFTYGNQNKTNSVMNKLRKEAASLGANGVLFRGTMDGPGGTGVGLGVGGGRFGGHGFGSAGVGVNISPNQKHGRGVAIYMRSPPLESPSTRSTVPNTPGAPVRP